SIQTMELKEIEEITYKTVYEKISRKGQTSNLLDGDITEQPKQTEVKEINLTNEDNSNITVELNYNTEKNGIELKFSGIPTEGTRQLLKENGFRWSKY